MKKPRVYSRYWRKNRSRHEATEFALALRALRKVAGHLGQNVKPVFWDGMVQDNDSVIVVDTENVKSDLPWSDMAHKDWPGDAWNNTLPDKWLPK